MFGWFEKISWEKLFLEPVIAVHSTKTLPVAISVLVAVSLMVVIYHRINRPILKNLVLIIVIMTAFFTPLSFSWMSLVVSFGFIVLERLQPRVRQHVLIIDVANNAILSVILVLIAILVLTPVGNYYLTHPPTWGLSALRLPLWLSTIVTCLLMDFVGYWLHRLEHEVEWLWHFHKVHHSIKHMSVVTQWRVHPEHIFYTVLPTFLLSYVLGVSLSAWAIWRLVNFMVGSLFTHSNLNIPNKKTLWSSLWTCIIASPNFHGQHHALQPDDRFKNYGGTFTIWDRLFGTGVERFVPVTEFGIVDSTYPAEEEGALAMMKQGFINLIPSRSSPVLLPARPSFRPESNTPGARSSFPPSS